MTTISLSPAATDFVWATGIENTFVPQTRPSHRALDEYELMGHYTHWRADLALARELGVRALRWGVPWYRVEPQPGQWDWRWTDEVLPYLVEELGITPIIDLMHYGCPLWLEREFINPHYPQTVAAYARAFAERYRGLVRWYTPLNEPQINALMCGKRGLWPPYLRGDTGYTRVMLQLAKGIARTADALKTVDPDAVLVFVEATGLSRAARADLQALVVEDQHRGYLCYDLLTGRVTPQHPLWSWLIRNGAHPDELVALAHAPVTLDIIGLNFYPQWSTTQLGIDAKGRLQYRLVEKDGAGFAALIRDYHARYGAPIMITETSAAGTSKVRTRWLATSVAAIRQLRTEGVPVHGYTWFPLGTMIDWRYRFGREPLEKYRIELGLYMLDRTGDGPRWLPTALVEQFQRYVRDPDAAIGPLRVADQAP